MKLINNKFKYYILCLPWLFAWQAHARSEFNVIVRVQKPNTKSKIYSTEFGYNYSISVDNNNCSLQFIPDNKFHNYYFAWTCNNISSILHCSNTRSGSLENVYTSFIRTKQLKDTNTIEVFCHKKISDVEFELSI